MVVSAQKIPVEEIETLWERTLSFLQEEIQPHAFNTWIKPLVLKKDSDGKLGLEVPNSFFRQRIQESFFHLIQEKLREVSGNFSLEVFVQVSEQPSGQELQAVSKTKQESVRKKPASGESFSMKEKYTFEAFVVGTNNQFAHAASKAVSLAPGQKYNPLFIYGGVGLGKTHLLCAIGNQVLRSFPDLRVLYRTSEQFTNELIYAIRFEKTQDFRARYRNSCDVLLLDDIHFFSGKERTQEEFFHTFNTLHQSGRQIVLTSDRLPEEIQDLDERLRSRFQWGLFADIQPPDVETRAAILKKKAETDHILLPDDVAFHLAHQIRSNIRALEGGLIRLAAHASLSGRPISIELAQEVLQNQALESSRLSIETIQKRVAQFFNLNISDLKSSRRHKVVAQPRQIAMFLSRKLTHSSFPEIGAGFGGKDHTTVMHGVQKIETLLTTDTNLKKTLTTIEQSLIN